MKKLATTLSLLLALAAPALAQTTPPTATAPAVARTEEYCMIMATAKLMSNKVTITVDYGQERKFFSGKFFSDNRYKDEAGKVVSFNSVIDVLNYQNSQGWDFVNAYAITVGGQNVYHYVMKRRIAV